MKKTLQIFAFAAIVLAALASCVKEQLNENTIPAGQKIQVSINGLIGELTPADATKATAGSVVRVTWETGDEVYVYDGTACIGTLTVTPDEKNASYALLSGTIKASTASTAPTKLTLVYVKGATEAPTIAGGKISIPLSTQDKADVPFVLYSTIDYDAAKLAKENEYISFSFATSVMTVNCTGLQTGAGTAVTKAEIRGVSTVCELAVTGNGVTVAGASKGTITRSETATPSVFTQSDSRGSFRLAIAADPAAPAARNILVHQGSKVSGAPFTSATLAGGQSYNTVYQLSEYVSDGAGGYAPAVKVTDVSLNKDKATIAVDATVKLEATVAPAGAANKTVNWLSSDETIASVDEYGKVTGKSKGSAVITATTTDGNFKAFCLVTVTPPVPVSNVSLDQTELTLYVGSSDVKLTATITPTDATNKNVTWSSSDTAVATVGNDGKVTAVAAGTATITVTTEDGAKTATCTVTVTERVSVTFVNPEGDINSTMPETQYIQKSSKASTPTSPTDQSGFHTFNGWYKTKDPTTGELSDKWNFNTEVTEDITLYAQWQTTVEKILSKAAVTFPYYNTTSRPNPITDSWVSEKGHYFYSYSNKIAVQHKDAGGPTLGFNDNCLKTKDVYKYSGNSIYKFYIEEGIFTKMVYDHNKTTNSDLDGTYTPRKK